MDDKRFEEFLNSLTEFISNASKESMTSKTSKTSKASAASATSEVKSSEKNANASSAASEESAPHSPTHHAHQAYQTFQKNNRMADKANRSYLTIEIENDKDGNPLIHSSRIVLEPKNLGAGYSDLIIINALANHLHDKCGLSANRVRDGIIKNLNDVILFDSLFSLIGGDLE